MIPAGARITDSTVVSARRPSRWTARVLGFVGAALSALLLWLMARRVVWAEAAQALSGARWWPALPLALSSYIFGQLVRGLRLRTLVNGNALLSVGAGTNLVVAGYASNNVFPLRLGELVRVGMLSARTGMPVGQALGFTLLERVVDGLAILFLVWIAAFHSQRSEWVQALTRVGALILGAAASILVAASARSDLLPDLASRIGALLGRRAQHALVPLSENLSAALAVVRRPSALVRLLLLSVGVWTAESLMFVALFSAFHLPVYFWRGVLVMGITNLGLLVPSAPGFVGSFHYFCSQALGRW